MSLQKEPQWKDITDVYIQKNVVRYLKFADFATDVKMNCISQLFLGMLPSVIWELLSTLQKYDWLYGIDDLIAKHIFKQNTVLCMINKVILAFFEFHKLSGLDYEYWRVLKLGIFKSPPLGLLALKSCI